MKHVTIGLLVSVAYMACAACSASESNDTTPEAIASAFCEKANSCVPVAVELIYGDVAACKSRQALSLGSSVAAANNPDVGGCAAAIRAMSCDEYRNTTGRPAACRFTGTAPNGKACGTDYQCSSGFCSFTGSCGVCADPPKAGDACAGYRCGPGLKCVIGTGERCVLPGKAGASCKTDSECEETLSCASDVCAARVGAGAACGSGKPDCQLGYYCGSAGVCTVLKFAALGETCGLVGSDYLFCKGGYCKSGGTGGSGTCAAYTADGQACSDTAGSCQEPASCVEGVCKLRDPAACK